MAYKFKPHSWFTLPRCIFPKQIVDVICNFPNKIPDILTFFQKSLLRNFWYEVRHSMIKSARNRAESIKNSHIPHDCEHIDLYTSPISRKSYTKFCSFQSNITFIWWVFTNYTIHWFEVKYIISSQIDTFISFARKIVSPSISALHWKIVHYENIYYTLPVEGSPTWVALFFYKRKVGIAAICLGLQNALNISDNSSIYNYYGTNRVIIV